ncbi:MAG: GNAT family N-acetyltransferase [Rhodobacteraceae bacterium]|nr:GNAT family N-acetyltransferase [Paracoccaceae bacterium]
MKVVYARSLSPADRRAAAELYWLAFGSKLARVLGPTPRALEFIGRVLDPAHVLIARDASGAILGVAGFRTAGGAFVGGGLADLLAVYGRVGGLWRAACLRLLARDMAEERIVVDGLSVRADMRGQGIGTALLEALCVEAQARGCRAVRLDVVEENLRARALYERLGFTVRARRASRFTRWLFDFDGFWVMVRPL